MARRKYNWRMSGSMRLREVCALLLLACFFRRPLSLATATFRIYK